MYSVVLSPSAERDIRSLISTDELAVRRALSHVRSTGTTGPHMRRVVQTGKPGLVAMGVTRGLRMLISQITETTVAVLAIVQHNHFDHVVSAAVEAARLRLPEYELQAAAGVIDRAGDQPADILQRQLRDAAPTVAQYAERSLSEGVNWNAVSAVGTWVAVVVAVITLILTLCDQGVDQNIYINIEQVFHIEDQ